MTANLTSTASANKRTRRATRNVDPAAYLTVPGVADAAAHPADASPATQIPSKLDRVESMLRNPGGASIAEIMTATGWQQHSVRGAMAGALKKRGLTIVSDKLDGVRRYRLEAAA
jgi:hypothetical protein